MRKIIFLFSLLKKGRNYENMFININNLSLINDDLSRCL